MIPIDIENEIKKGYTTIYFMDDSIKNIRAVDALKRKYPNIKLITKNCGNIGDGFIVLSEILLILHLNKFKIDETETIFINRKRGESSVNLNLIIQSLFGLIRLFFIKAYLFPMISTRAVKRATSVQNMNQLLLLSFK